MIFKLDLFQAFSFSLFFLSFLAPSLHHIWQGFTDGAARPTTEFAENKQFVQKKKTCPDLPGSNPLPRCSPGCCSRRLTHPTAEAPVRRKTALEQVRSYFFITRWTKSISCKEHLLQRASCPAKSITCNEHLLPAAGRCNSTQPLCALLLPVLIEHPTELFPC